VTGGHRDQSIRGYVRCW